MRILIDTNVLISSILGGGIPYQAYNKAVIYPNIGIFCEQNIEELRRIFNEKFPNKTDAMEEFLKLALMSVEVIPIPTEPIEIENLIRDEKDKTIMRAAAVSGVDVILTGDKDFLESGIESPKIMSPAEFLNMEN